MNLEQMGLLIAEFGNLPSEQARDGFLVQHPELKNVDVVRWVLKAARMNRQMGDINLALKLSVIAFLLGGEIQAHKLGAEASELAAELYDEIGNPQKASEARMTAFMLRSTG